MPKPYTADAQINFRVAPEEKKAFQAAADRAGRKLSNYIKFAARNQMMRDNQLAWDTVKHIVETASGAFKS